MAVASFSPSTGRCQQRLGSRETALREYKGSTSQWYSVEGGAIDESLQDKCGTSDFEPGRKRRHVCISDYNVESAVFFGIGVWFVRVLTIGRRCIVSTLWITEKKSLRWEI